MEKVQIRLNDSAIRNLNSAILVGNRPHSCPYRRGVLAKLPPRRHKNECPDIGHGAKFLSLQLLRPGGKKGEFDSLRKRSARI